ncbi:MAG: rhodanese-like domain-containing protein [Candidatus Liptonbacteria bacterium]|nr:rhodanese-like domain-containing protein [Candidatus Liptonbacteria bacterium]
MDAVVEKVNSKAVFLIDVRTEREWNSGHAKGAIHFELSKIQKGGTPELPRDAKIYLYCRSGNRSGIANDILKKAGFKNTENLGGLSDWQALGGEIEK